MEEVYVSPTHVMSPSVNLQDDLTLSIEEYQWLMYLIVPKMCFFWDLVLNSVELKLFFTIIRGMIKNMVNDKKRPFIFLLSFNQGYIVYIFCSHF